MNGIYNHKTISFYWPFGPRDSGPVGKPIIPPYGVIKGLLVRQSSLADSITLDAIYLEHPSKGGSPMLDFRSSGVI